MRENTGSGCRKFATVDTKGMTPEQIAEAKTEQIRRAGFGPNDKATSIEGCKPVRHVSGQLVAKIKASPDGWVICGDEQGALTCYLRGLVTENTVLKSIVAIDRKERSAMCKIEA